MIDVYAAAGTFSGKHKLPQDLANAIRRWEKAQEHLREALKEDRRRDSASSKQ